jgi:cytochrome c biogenesis protein CcmG/thiol:disulfide interchange protein DsbE
MTGRAPRQLEELPEADRDQEGIPEPTDRRDRRWRATVLSLVPIVAIAALLGYGLGRNPRDVPNALVGQPAPGFVLKDLATGRTLRLSELRGHPVVVNFWASWCAECVAEHPNLFAAWQHFGDSGVVFVSILFEDSAEQAADFDRQLGRGWPDLADPGSRTALAYGVRGVPETFFIDSRGIIRFQKIGPSSYELLAGKIRHLMAPSGKGVEETAA